MLNYWFSIKELKIISIKRYFASLLLAMMASSASAGLVGPGPEIDPPYLTGDPSLVIDTNSTLRVGRGNWEATHFNYAAVAGNTTPFLAIRDESNLFRIIAIGDRHDITVPTYGATTDFGGHSRFTLDRPTTLYAGIVTYEGDNPIRIYYPYEASVYQPFPRSRLVLNGVLDTNNPDNPTYFDVPYLFAFSIEVERARVNRVPEPATLLLSGLGVCALVVMRRKKRPA